MKVRFHLPNFTEQFNFDLVFINMLKNCPDFFREGVEIASFYGTFPQSLWNGGRVTLSVCDENYVKGVVNTFSKLGIPLRFTFTNPVLTEEHLHDKFCNNIMKIADNGLNEVIVNSPLLEDYIRKTYPNYKLTSSTTKRINDLDNLKDELEKDYSLVVVDYDFNNKYDLLEQLPHKDKCEFLVNACCDPKCERRAEHYRIMGVQQIAFCDHLKKHPGKPITPEAQKNMPIFECPKKDRSVFDIQELETYVSPDDIWEKYVPMGFSNFKIEGRMSSRLNLIETYLHYMIKPEVRDRARAMLLVNLEKNGVVRIG